MSTELSIVAAKFLESERRLTAIREYHSNLPKDRKYDLGLRMDVGWASSAPGYSDVRLELQKIFTAKLRDQIDAILRDAELEHHYLREELREMASR